MANVRTYRSAVKIGNWYENLCLEEVCDENESTKDEPCLLKYPVALDMTASISHLIHISQYYGLSFIMMRAEILTRFRLCLARFLVLL